MSKNTNAIIAVAVSAAVGIFLWYRLFRDKKPIKEDDLDTKTTEDVKEDEPQPDDNIANSSAPSATLPVTQSIPVTQPIPVEEKNSPKKHKESGVFIRDEIKVAIKRGDKEWIDDNDVSNCMICDVKFSTLVCLHTAYSYNRMLYTNLAQLYLTALEAVCIFRRKNANITAGDVATSSARHARQDVCS